MLVFLSNMLRSIIDSDQFLYINHCYHLSITYSGSCVAQVAVQFFMRRLHYFIGFTKNGPNCTCLLDAISITVHFHKPTI